jgi:prenylcysteine oxidase/farnesylcysteine lyase
VNVNITLFERTDRIGGRTRTINAFDDPSQPFEQGASIFVQINHVLYDSMIKFGLTPRDPDVSSDPLFGIWDGDKFVLAIDANAPSWWNSLKVLFRYGLSAPKRTRELRLDTIGRFLRIYTPDFFPFKSLTERAEQLNLTEATGVTGQQHLKAHGVCSFSLTKKISGLCLTSTDWWPFCKRVHPVLYPCQLCFQPGQA